MISYQPTPPLIPTLTPIGANIIRSVFCVILYVTTTFTVTANDLPKPLAEAIKSNGFNSEGLGLYIRAIDATEPLVAYGADTPLNPASVIKLVTTAAALARLGSGYHWSTDVWYTGPIQAGKLDGNLYFHGNGDPYMTPERFWLLLNRVLIYGVHTITGDILLDNTYFSPAPINYAAFDEQPYRTYNVGPNALLVGFQATEFHFNPGDRHVEIIPFPDSPKLRIVNQVKLVDSNCGAWQKNLTLATKTIKDVLQVTFTGRYAKSCEKRELFRRVSDSENHFQHFFLPLWRQLGGSFNGQIKEGKLPDNAKLIIKGESISLAEAVRMINKFSNNVMTQQVLLSLGAQLKGPPGTTEKGIQAVTDWLNENHLADHSLKLDNGAGLSRDTRVSAALLGRLLHFVFQQTYMPEFISSLPVSGYDGSMAHRFQDEPVVGHAHMKTGLLDFVQTMAGYVTTASGRRYVVVLLHNHERAHTQAGERLQIEVIRWVYNLP